MSTVTRRIKAARSDHSNSRLCLTGSGKRFAEFNIIVLADKHLRSLNSKKPSRMFVQGLLQQKSYQDNLAYLIAEIEIWTMLGSDYYLQSQTRNGDLVDYGFR